MRVPAERLDVSPALMSLSFSLPPRCQLEVSLGVQKKFLPGSRFAFSPDKGLDVGGAIVLDKVSCVPSFEGARQRIKVCLHRERRLEKGRETVRRTLLLAVWA